MGLFKSTDQKKDAEEGMSLLKGLLVLALIGIIAAVVVSQFVN